MDIKTELYVPSQSQVHILLLEPFYCGSHKQLIDSLLHDCDIGPHCHLVTMSGKKWQWRSRTSSLHMSNVIPHNHNFRVLFSSSILNLAELVALRPDLAGLHKIVYFHENQLCYPVRLAKERDFQYGYNQILTCLVADRVLFNSYYNMESFLSSIDRFLRLMPDYRQKGLVDVLGPKCSVLYFPLTLEDRLSPVCSSGAICQAEQLSSEVSSLTKSFDNTKLEATEGLSSFVVNEIRLPSPPLHIVWNHRWEHDKNPEIFFSILIRLHDEGEQFLVSVLGENFADNPEIFAKAEKLVAVHIQTWGYQKEKRRYFQVLAAADVVVSTSKHEFFGVAVLEAVSLGCYPLCPNALVYPEFYPKQCLYSTPIQLYRRLQYFCRHPHLARRRCPQVKVIHHLERCTDNRSV